MYLTHLQILVALRAVDCTVAHWENCDTHIPVYVRTGISLLRRELQRESERLAAVGPVRRCAKLAGEGRDGTV